MTTVTAGTAHKPTAAYNNRIDVIDVLRGFALLGIITVHSSLAYSGVHLREDSAVDTMLAAVIAYTVDGKFYPIFSFLFGLSFFIQLQRAKAKNKKFIGRFIWRSAILFAIGLLHSVFFIGDVLYKYAFLGLLLLFTGKLSNKVLLLLSILLIFFMPYLMKLQSTPTPQPTVTAQKTIPPPAVNPLKDYKAKQAESIKYVIKSNAKAISMYWMVIHEKYFTILGLFLLGVIAGRREVFLYTKANLLFFKQMLVCAAVVVIILLLVNPQVTHLKTLSGFLRSLNQVAISCFYISGVTILYWKTSFKTVLGIFDPVGKMGLTIYVMQTAFGLLFFYHFGFDMINRLSLSAGVASGLLFFLFQILFAGWWMSRFRFGPLEWVWRSLTYFKLQPLLKRTD